MSAYLPKLLIIVFLAFLALPLITEGAITFPNPIEAKTFEELLDAIINFLFWISLPIAALMIVVAAFYLLTSAGDPEKVKTARQIIIWTLAGVVVIFLSKALIAMITNVFGGAATP